MHNRPVLDQDFLRRIANYDNSAVKQLIEMINHDIDQLCALFKRPDFSLEAITALIQTINADTACIMSDDNFKDDRADIRKRLTNGIEAAMQAVSYKNYERSRDALNIIMDKKTGLAMLQGGIMKKTSMQRLEAIRNKLNKLIKERDEHLLDLIHAENLDGVKKIINAGGKVDWAIFLKSKKIDFTKGPVKTLVDFIRDDMVALVDGLHTDNVNNLIAVVNQKIKYFSDDAKFRPAMGNMARFFHERFSRLRFNSQSVYLKEYLRGVNAVLEALDLVHFSFFNREVLTDLLCKAKISLENQLVIINSQLVDAIKKLDLEGVSRAIFNGADINHVGQLGKTPLRLAVLSGGLAIVDRLLYMGADLSDVSHAIRDAVGLSRYDIAESLIIKGINIINEKRNTQDSLVKWVAENKYVRLFLMLINRGVEVDWPFIKANVDESGVSFLRDQLIESMSLDLLDIAKNDNKLAFINAAQSKLNLLKAESDNPFVISHVSKAFLVEALSRHYYAFDSEATVKFQQLLIGLGVDPKTMGLEAPRPVVVAAPEPEPMPAVEVLGAPAVPTKPVVSDNPLTNGLICEEFRGLIDATDAKAIADLIESINKKTEVSIQANVVDDLVKVVSEKREALAKTQDEPTLKAVHDCITTVAAQLSMVESLDALKQALNNLIEHLKVRMEHLADIVKVPPGRPHTVFRELTRKEKKAQEKAEKEKPYKNIKEIEATNYFGADDKGFFTL